MTRQVVGKHIWILALLVTILVLGVSSFTSRATSTGIRQEISTPTPEPADSSSEPEVPSDWLATVQENLQQAEYNVTWQEQTYLGDIPAAYQSPNRVNNLRAYYAPQGLIVIPRTWVEVIETPPWRIEISLSAWGRAGMLSPVSEASLAAAKSEGATNRIDYMRDSIVEWYRNDENGIEQGFTLSSPPVDGDGILQLDLLLSGSLNPQMNSSGDGIEFMNDESQAELRYGGLAAVDAEGKPLPAHMSLEGDTLSLIIDDAGAIYPIEVDPLLTGLPSQESWEWSISQAGAQFGYSVATAGDVNADGYSDVIIGIPNYDGGHTDEGMAVVFYGSIDGLKPQDAGIQPDWTKVSGLDGALFGWSVSTAGDVDGDGDCEVIVGAPGWDESSYDGGAWVYYGSPEGLLTTPGEYYHGTSGNDAAFGISVAFAGDVNNDGYADIIIGAPKRSNSGTESQEGYAMVYNGSTSGLSNSFDWLAEGEQSGAMLGQAVATAGDVNGDGFADVIVGADWYDNGQSNEGKVFVWYGSEDGVNGDITGQPANADWSAEMDSEYARFGAAVSTAGDVNGDGYADVIIGAPFYSESRGVARLYLGSLSGLETDYDKQFGNSDIDAQLGKSVGTVGDVNGDGYADIIISAPYYTNDLSAQGRIYVFYGSADGINTVSPWITDGKAANDWFGVSVATAGDVNGDGYSDIIVGAPGVGSSAGAAYAYYGAAGSLEKTAGWTKRSNLENANFGHSVASAGDINADGYADIIVGAPQWDGGLASEGIACLYIGSATGLLDAPPWCKEGGQLGVHFGWSVSTAGDVNGDGYDDVVIGAPNYKYVNHDNEGMIWVYLGSYSGLATTPYFSKDSDQDNAQFGYAVGNAGDVNGDGYGDIIVGAPFLDNTEEDEGSAWLYIGSADGLIDKPAWHFYGDQNNAQLGYDVGTAGDINADGYSDVIVGAPYWDNEYNDEGGAWVFLGSRFGLSDTYIWQNEGNKNGAHYGFSVSTAGDVNGDGYSDIIVGAPSWIKTYTNEGAAFVFHSNGAGLDMTPSWSKVSNLNGAMFGYSVNLAGDVNGDGFADIIVGAYHWTAGESHEGGAWVYHGSPGGVISAPQWYAQGEQNSAEFGTSVASAGDVNGDGYADVVVGAPQYTDVYNAEGQAFVYYGNESKGAAMALKSNDWSGDPIAHLGKFYTDAIQLSMIQRSPFGRGDVMHEIEIKPLRTDFNAQGTYSPYQYYNYTLDQEHIPLPSDDVSPCMPIHWRLRVIYSPATTPFMPASRWVTIPWNGWNEMDLRPSGLCVSLPIILRDD